MEQLTPQSLKRFHLWASQSARLGGSPLLAPGKKQLGGGTELAGTRDYAPGDCFQHIDWKHCARRDELVVKLYEGAADRTIYLLLDCSASMTLAPAAKFQIAKQIVAALGFMVLQSGDRVKVTGFAAGPSADLPALRSSARLTTLLRFLGELAQEPRAVDLARTVERFVARAQRPGPVIVVSDLYDPRGFSSPLDNLRTHGYDPRIVFMIDPRDAEPGRLGDAEIVGVSTGRSILGTITPRTARRYAQLLQEYRQSVVDYCRRRAIYCLAVSCDESEEAVLRTVFFSRTRQQSNLSTVGRR